MMIKLFKLNALMRRFAVVFVAAGFTCAMSPVAAKLPAPSEEAKAKAEEAKVKAAENAKKDADLLSKYQDDIALKYAAKLKAEGKEFKPTPLPAAVPTPAPVAPATVTSSIAAPAAAPGAAVTPKK
jgi:hypothetical protein